MHILSCKKRILTLIAFSTYTTNIHHKYLSVAESSCSTHYCIYHRINTFIAHNYFNISAACLLQTTSDALLLPSSFHFPVIATYPYLISSPAQASQDGLSPPPPTCSCTTPLLHRFITASSHLPASPCCTASHAHSTSFLMNKHPHRAVRRPTPPLQRHAVQQLRQ